MLNLTNAIMKVENIKQLEGLLRRYVEEINGLTDEGCGDWWVNV